MPEIVIDAREAFISEHMSVRRILPFRKRRMVGPFIFMDHAGPISIQPSQMERMDVLPHPHIGLSTVTYLFGGQVTHRDSLGVEQIIRPGEVNWMTAGKGISHSERFEDPVVLAKTSLEMLQTWVALPEEYEEIDPEFDNYKPEQLGTYTDKGIWMRMIAGSAYGLKSSVKTHSPLFYCHVNLEAGARLDLPREHAERGVYIAKGTLEVNGYTYKKGQLLVFSKNEEAILKAKDAVTIMLLGGETVGERHIWWNFVSSSKERIEQAKADWKAGRIALPQQDNEEFVPLPENAFRKRTDSDDAPEPQALS
ncbi:MAG TPA: pirin family protein [Flavobacteriaceae bacterium]|nr:pirin family protein [Flavobacteriaceae bacterium]